MINDWTVRKTAIVEADDFCDRYDRNGLNFLFYWKTRYPKFKITLFTIPAPERTSKDLLRLVVKHNDWIELAVHGWNHESNFECYSWSYEKTTALMDRVAKNKSSITGTPYYQKIFKAPGWTITDRHNGYPASDELPIKSDSQGVYKALNDMDYIIFDRHYNKPTRPEGSQIVCVDCNPDIVHMHTWNMETGDMAGKNGFEQVEELHGVPWDRDTDFYFASEAYKQGLFQECHD